MTPDTTYTGRYSDGASAAAVAAVVRLTGQGVEIEPAAGGPVIIWPYAALGTAVPLSRRSSDVLLTFEYTPGSTLFVASEAFARQLLAAAPHLSARSERWRAARPWIWAVAVLAAVAGGLWLAGLSPANAIARLLPDNVRQSMGAQVVASMSGKRRICDAAAGRAALDRLTERLSAASGAKARFHVIVVDWGLLNAFAAPGEQIMLTRGLIEKAGGPDELAGVLAHEMGHGIELHPETAIVRSIGLAAGIELLSGGGSNTLANLGLFLAQLSYSRAAEREADRHSLRILKAAGISPKGIADFFKRIERREGSGSGTDILRTHPLSAERAAAAASQPTYPSTPAMDAADWEALQAICKT